MSSPGTCPRCQTPLPAGPGGGVVVCPGCGSKLSDTPAAAETAVEPRPPAVLPDTLTAAHHPDVAPTASVDLDSQFSPGPATARAPRLPQYDDLVLVGSGGMGVVYRATQHKTERTVAVKFLHAGGAIDPALRARFDGEARALARVEHPHIVRIFEVGEDEAGRPYFTMEYVPGGSLGRRLRAGPVTPREAAGLIAGVARAVEAAHRVRVLHRDIKPGNILLAADGAAKIADFGLAKHGDRDEGLTASGAVMGTLSYMAPEQASGGRVGFDPRVDVYGLGATLYELLCGEPPYRGRTNAETLRLVERGHLVPPSMRRGGVPGGLEAICLRCLERAPGARYQSAGELADDLDAWLAGEPTKAQPLTRWGRTKRWVRRHRIAVALAALLPFAALGAAVADPERRLDWQLAAGRPVTVIGPKGGPSWHEWKLGRVELGLSADEDGACGFQTHTTSVLVLARDPRHDSYSVSVELKHISASADDAEVGVFVGLYDTPAQPDLAVTRFVGLSFTEFWRDAEIRMPELKRTHGLDMKDVLVVRDGDKAPVDFCDYGVVPFTPYNNPTRHPWRRVRLDVSPAGVDVFWLPTDETTVPSFRLTADEITGMVASQHGLWKQHGYQNFSMPQRPWTPRAALGVFATNSAVAVRNFTVTPAGAAP